ncbi:Protein ECERIFERUM 1 [Glycine soja]|uniref:Protein ECERIFERUM 1 n=1 Tax=Glycine soja TaxID=3848 RepID=A0A445LA54_GLYSO|nr:Protein ECERIFERUM 1 [Glycine soja]
MTACSMMLRLVYGRTFIVEGNRFNKLKLQSWAIPKYSQQYFMISQKMSINKMIEEAILEAHQKGIKLLCLGLLNQGENLNIYGGLYVSKHPNLRVKVVDGSSLALAVVVLNGIPNRTTQVLLRGKLTKVTTK